MSTGATNDDLKSGCLAGILRGLFHQTPKWVTSTGVRGSSWAEPGFCLTCATGTLTGKGQGVLDITRASGYCEEMDRVGRTLQNRTGKAALSLQGGDRGKSVR